MYFTSFHCTGRYELIKVDLAPTVWLHSSVGRASHWCRAEVTDLAPAEALIFSEFLLSNCLNWKIYFTLHLPSKIMKLSEIGVQELFKNTHVILQLD